MMITAITGARIFDGERVIEERTVVLDGQRIVALGGPVPDGATVVDARGATLLPGLIDSHVHTSPAGLRDALSFGVTTELEMQGRFTSVRRGKVADRDDLADVRSAGFALTAPGGHPSELFPGDGPPPGVELPDPSEGPLVMPDVSTPEEAAASVAALVADGSDYIKIMIEEGSVLGHPGLPTMSEETVAAGVRAAHEHGRMALAHALTAEATAQGIATGVDGFTHVFIDRPHPPELVAALADAGAFVIPCLVLVSSIMGGTGAELAADERVRSKLSQPWLDTLCGSFDVYPQGKLEDVLATVGALHAAGVDVLAGTDVSVPVPSLGGLAHGASLHHELRLLVAAGLTPVQALRAATALPARRFGLTDRGRVAPGARADLLLVDGDPTTTITDTLGIRAVWRRGVRQETA
ncbi:amidohydrolase family protein [Micromonospora sp. NEAU-HG-1]|nr:amidohydrolase family protein [Micromonospora rubida]